jgi:hypothetical protein
MSAPRVHNVFKSPSSSRDAAPSARYEAALESSPHLLDQLRAAGDESLSLRGEVAAARVLLGESLRVLGRAHNASGGVLSGAAVQLVSENLRQVNAMVTSCAAIEAKRLDQSLDAAKVALLLARLRDDLRRSLKEAGQIGAIPFIDAAFDRAKWTGALDADTVRDALAAPASFDVKFRPIERDAMGRVHERNRAFDRAEDALLEGGQGGLPLESDDARDPLTVAEDRALLEDIERANAALDGEIEDAAESGAPLPGVTPPGLPKSRLNRLDALLDDDADGPDGNGETA